MEKEKVIVVKCPHCGYEYLPCEIFFPDEFLGQATNIIRDESGKILFWDGDSMNLKEEFVCDNCGTPFSIEGQITFKTKENKDMFDDDWTTSDN